jgi:hypothetical protein
MCPAFVREHGLALGGGTRIALELGGYRESEDIDMFCLTTSAFRAVRETMTSESLGALFARPVTLARDVRSMREKILTAIEVDGFKVKFEVLDFSGWNLKAEPHPLFPIPVLDRASCFVTKLTAANDRGRSPPYKDVVDLLAMTEAWGECPPNARAEAERQYGRFVIPKAEEAIARVCALPQHEKRDVARRLGAWSWGARASLWGRRH